MDKAQRGAELRRLRKAAGLAQWHVAAEFGISDSAVSQWEKGDSNPDYRRLIRLDELYHCNGEILALFDLGISWRDEAARLRDNVAALDLQVQDQAKQLAGLAAAVKRLQRPPRRSAGGSQ